MKKILARLVLATAFVGGTVLGGAGAASADPYAHNYTYHCHFSMVHPSLNYCHWSRW